MPRSASTVGMTSIRLTGAAIVPRSVQARRSEDERHAKCRVVDEHAVRFLAVLAQRLSVVGGYDDERAIEASPLVPMVEQHPDDAIGVRDFSVRSSIRRSSARAPADGRGVRVEQVDPGENRPRRPARPASARRP